jgi:AcrR family transcriptional regulator
MKMGSESGVGRTGAGRVGRPARVSTADIAEAALEIGLDRATVRNVAAHLGMSVPGLYHHVRTRDELLAVASVHALGSVGIPDDRGQPWEAWLVEYATVVFDRLIAHPEVVWQICAGTVDVLQHTRSLERFLQVLTARGFTPSDAFETYVQVMGAVTGAAALRIGERAKVDEGRAPLEPFRHAADAIGTESTPLVHEVLRTIPPSGFDPFDAVRLVVAGIAARRDRLVIPEGSARPTEPTGRSAARS